MPARRGTDLRDNGPAMSTPNLAESLAPARHATAPFPHFRVEGALGAGVAEALIAQFPSLELITRGAEPGDNRRFSYSAADAVDEARLAPLWRDFVAMHVSQAFLDGVLRALAPDIRAAFPGIEARMGKPLEQWRAGVRRRQTFADCEVLLDAQVCVNTPVLRAASSVRGPHVDKPNKLFAGLYYLRPPADTATVGGELQLYRYTNPRARFDGAELDPRDVELVATVPYAADTFVLFVNSLAAVHGVTPRQPTPATRLFFNLIGEVAFPLFDLKSRQQPLRGLRRALRRVGDRLAGRQRDSGQRYD